MNNAVARNMIKPLYESSDFELRSIAVPNRTNTYKPVSHSQLIDQSLEAIDKNGFSVDSVTYTMARDGMQANGRYSIRNNDSDMGIMVGWQNSYDKSISLKFAIGAHVFICSNGMVKGDMGTFKKKHTGDVERFTTDTIRDYIDTAGEVFETLKREKEDMKNVFVGDTMKAELLGVMFVQENVITITQLSTIKQEYDKPTHDYSASNSLWELYNYTTFALKDSHPSLYYDNHMKVHKFFKELL